VSVVPDRSAPTYRQLLEEAQELGRVDGGFAAFESPGTAVASGERCLGRTPAEFALLLWEDRTGDPPVGLELNGPLRYAGGFRRRAGGVDGGAPSGYRMGTRPSVTWRQSRCRSPSFQASC
jgi:hypothetical protein